MQKYKDFTSAIIITGGAGFIGSYLCEHYLNKKYQVFCVDNLITGQKNNIAHLLKNKNFKFLQADITKQATIKKIESLTTDRHSPITILHFASPAGPHPTSPKSYLQLPVKTYLVNSYATHLLLKLAKDIKADFVFASTSEVYGDPKEHPQKESYFGYVNPIGPRSCYDESKRFGEMATITYSEKHHLKSKIIRIFNTYGPRMNPEDGRAIPLFISQALKNQTVTIFGDGNQTRSFCYIDDLVSGIAKIVEKGRPGEVYNLGNPDEITINQTVKKIISLINSSSDIVHKDKLKDDPQRRCPDIAKIKKQTGWHPKISFETGLKKTIKYFSEND